VGPRIDLNAVGIRKGISLPGIEPELCSPLPITVSTGIFIKKEDIVGRWIIAE
jgi:hypothetical protein